MCCRLLIFLLLNFLFLGCDPDTGRQSGQQDENALITLHNDQIILTIQKIGGSIVRFSPANQPINPLSWAMTPDEMPENNRNGAPFKGHFLCTGRWGSPSEGEISAGVLHNGSVSNTPWNVLKSEDRGVSMENLARPDGLRISRKIELFSDIPGFLVTESFLNTHTLGRVHNVVQHVTLGPPFLSDQLILQANATEGFNQKFSYPDPELHDYMWPYALIDTLTGEELDLRTNNTPHNLVSTHLVQQEDTYGWIVAYDPESSILLGYCWKREDYPWINIWNHFEDGSPVAKGLEFGTTGIGLPYRMLLETDTRFFGENSWEYIDAGQQIQKSYTGFIIDSISIDSTFNFSVTGDSIWLDGQSLFRNPLR